MSLFDIKIPYTVCEDLEDPVEMTARMSDFADQIKQVYGIKINEYLNKGDRYETFKKNYGKKYKEYLKESGLPDSLEFSGELVRDALVKKSRRGYVLLEISMSGRIPGTTRSIESYIRSMDYGTLKFPALNVVRKANREIIDNLRRYYNEYSRTGSISSILSNRNVRQSSRILSRRGNR